MILRLFKNNRAGGIVVVFLIAAGLFTLSMIHPVGISSYQAMPFYNLVFGFVHNISILNRLVALVFLFILGNILIRIGLRFVLLDDRSFMPAIFFLIFTITVPQARQLSPALVASVFFLLSFRIIFEVDEKSHDNLSLFIAGLLLALGSMFYLKLIWFLPLFWISVATMRAVSWRELFYPVIAYLILGLLLFTWYWGIQDEGKRFVDLLKSNLAFEGGFRPMHYSVYIFYAFFIFLGIIASVYMINRFQILKTLVQNIYQVLFFMFLAGTIFFVFIARFDLSALLFIAFPLSLNLSKYFHRRKNHWSQELMIWILLGLVGYVQVMTW